MMGCSCAGRPEDGALATLCELALFIVYVCVIVIKTCEKYSAACTSYGFTDSKGVLWMFG